MNEEAVREKIGSDAYRLFGDGLFATPETRLSLQPILDPYTQDDCLVQTYANPEAAVQGSSGVRPLTNSLRFMSKFIPGYFDFEKILVPYPEDAGKTISFMEYIQIYGRPSEIIIEPNTRTSLPIYGVMAVLAAATSLGDLDVLGGGGKNCGLIFLRSSEGKAYEAFVVKIDPGCVFRYEAEEGAGIRQRSSSKNKCHLRSLIFGRFDVHLYEFIFREWDYTIDQK